MNRSELISAVAEQASLSRKEADAAVSALIDVVTDTLKKGDKLSLIGFGTFEVSERAAREGKNPLTGEKIQIPACKIPKFKAGKALKDSLN